VVLVAGLLVLAGLGSFLAGVLTGVAAWYWACVVACALAVVALLVSRLRGSGGTPVPAGRPGSEPVGSRSRTAAGATAVTATPLDGARARTTTVAVTEPGATSPAGPGTAEQPVDGRDGGAADGPGGPAARPDRVAGHRRSAGSAGDPAEEDVEVTDLLIVVDLTDEVLVVDEHPRYHLADCRWLAGRETVPLPVAEARTDGFTPCAVCGPDAALAAVERARRAARRD
jgi:hypothetical protein